MNNSSTKIPKFLFIFYIILFAILSIHPHDRAVWFTENATVLVVVIPLTIMYIKGIRFSAISYILMAIFVYMHTIGGHYTFALVPFDWFNNFFGFKRNMYDRVAHFSVGFYALPIYEFVRARKLVSNKVMAGLFALFAIVTVAAFYELFEWQYAIHSDPSAGLEVLGSQGDIWDAQKDMLSDTLGAVVILIGIWMSTMFRKGESKY